MRASPRPAAGGGQEGGTRPEAHSKAGTATADGEAQQLAPARALPARAKGATCASLCRWPCTVVAMRNKKSSKPKTDFTNKTKEINARSPAGARLEDFLLFVLAKVEGVYSGPPVLVRAGEPVVADLPLSADAAHVRLQGKHARPRVRSAAAAVARGRVPVPPGRCPIATLPSLPTLSPSSARRQRPTPDHRKQDTGSGARARRSGIT